MRICTAVLAAALLLAGCKESLTNPDPSRTSMEFSYRLGTGAWQPFAADGQQPASTPFAQRGEWVYTGSATPQHSTLLVFAHQRTGSEWHSLQVYVPNVAGWEDGVIGDAQAMTCPDPQGRRCTQAAFYITDGAESLKEICILTSGSFQVTRRTDEWVSGRLSGAGNCRVPGGAATRPVEIRDGAFDLALPPPAAAPG